MATLIATADGNITGAATFAATEIGTGALNLVRNTTSTFAAAAAQTSATFTVTNAKVIDGAVLWLKVTAVSPTGTFKVDLQKSAVSQASVTVNKADLPDSTNAISCPVFFKFTGTATGDGAATWTIVVTTTGTGTVTYNLNAAGATNWTRALRTTTTQAPVAGDDLYVVGELTGAGTKNTRTVMMDSTVATVYGNGAVNSASVNGGGIHISNWGTLTYGNALTWVTTFSQTLTADSGGWIGYNLRQVMSAANLSVSGSKVRITIQAAASGFVIDFAQIGHAAASGDVYDFDGGQVPLTFSGGSSGCTVAGSGTIRSDEITFNLDETKNLIMAVHFSGTSAIKYIPATTSAYYKAGASEVSVSNVTGYTSNESAMISLIEVASGTSGTTPGTNYILRVAGDVIVYQYGTLNMGSSAATADSAEVTAFLARTSGLDVTHTNAYTALIDGLVADGVWAKLDMLHIYATQDSTTAKLNLKSSSYTGIANGSPTFTADRGFTGVDTSTTVYINTQFNPATAVSPQFVQNSAHISEWALNSISPASGASAMGGSTSGSATSIILPQYSGQTYFQLNSASYNAFPTGTSVGHYLSNRSLSNAIQQYRNGSSIQATGDASVAVVNANIYTLANNNNGTAAGAGYQLCMASIGSSLTSGEVLAFYNRLRTYMTAVGVP